MNSRTAKLLNRYAVYQKLRPKAVKREWEKLDAKKRAATRKRIRRVLEGAGRAQDDRAKEPISKAS